MERRKYWPSQIFGTLAVSLVLALAGCGGTGGSAVGGAGSNGSATGDVGPLPGPSVMPQNLVVLDPQSDQQAPLKLKENGSITVTASENGYNGSFSARVVEGTCISVEANRASQPTTSFDVRALDSPCAIASITVTDQNSHSAADFFSVH
jgi:hypothetical protein